MIHTPDIDEARVEIGKIVGVHGLGGWLKVFSYTEPRDALFAYKPLQIGEKIVERCEGKAHGKGLLLRIDGCDNRDAVEGLVGSTVSIGRKQLAKTAPGEFYQVDLVGLTVVNLDGDTLGVVEKVIPGPANDALLVAGDEELLIPFTFGHSVIEVDLDSKRLIADWQADW